MRFLKAYKFRLYPTQEQESKLRQHGGNTRFLWNLFLDLNQQEYAKNKKFIFAHDLITSLPTLKKEHDFLALSFSQSLQQVGRYFDRALKDFIKGEKEFPTRRKKCKERDSFTVPQKFRIEKKYVFIPKIGEVAWVKHRPIKGKVKHITIKQDGDQWYCSVSVELKVKQPEVKTENVIGIDVGLKIYATHSDGEVVENPKTLYKWQKKLNRANRRLHKRTKGSNNRNKQKQKLSRIHRKIRNIRRDFQHKKTCCTIAKCDGVCLETLNVKGMMKNRHLAKAIADCGWYEYKRQLRYKCQWYGKIFVEIDRFEPTSKCCSRCGWKDVNLCLSDRVFRCKCCGLEIDRDLNASVNIRNCGLKILSDGQEYTPGDDWRLQMNNQCQSVSQEQRGMLFNYACVN